MPLPSLQDKYTRLLSGLISALCLISISYPVQVIIFKVNTSCFNLYSKREARVYETKTKTDETEKQEWTKMEWRVGWQESQKREESRYEGTIKLKLNPKSDGVFNNKKGSI